MADAPRMELRGVTKRFPGVLAADRVSFAVRPGEIHALLGENGAGKSTIVKMIYGVLQPDAGEILWDGRSVAMTSPKAARAMGVGMVFQHFSLFEALTVLENIALGMDRDLGPRALEAEVRRIMAEYGLALDPHRVVSTLGVGERQRIEIVRALLLEPKLLIMDEPTSVLTPQEVALLFRTLRRLASNGCAILYISHKLGEIRELCDVATILRAGRVVATCDPSQESPRGMAELMIGAGLRQIAKSSARRLGPPKLVVRGLSLPKTDAFGTALADVSFSVRAGEIVGVAGVAGNGQNELLLALAGEIVTADPDAILLGGRPVGAEGVGARRRAGLAAAPEERNGHAAVAEFSLAENVLLTARDRMGLAQGGLVRAARARGYAAEIIRSFAVKAAGPDAPAESLSGGNLQKFVMGREILQTPEVLVVSQPTWGVDAGAAVAIHQALLDLAARGSAIVLISQDLDELLALCDGIAVINQGRLSPVMAVDGIAVDDLGLLMGGVHGDPKATAELAHDPGLAGVYASEAAHAR